jgi:hypothetical protein
MKKLYKSVELNSPSKKVFKKNSYKIVTNKKSPKKSSVKSTEMFTIKNLKNLNITILNIQRQFQLNIHKILLINLTSTVTEIAKLLMLSGFNLYLYDNEIINENDINCNIFLEKKDLGKNRLDVLYNYLIPLNITVSVAKIYDYTSVKDYKIVIFGFSDFFTLLEYEKYFNRKGILFFCVNTSGIYAFCYHNMIEKSHVLFDDTNKKDEKNKKNIEKNSENLSNFVKKREKLMKGGKIGKNDYLIFSIFMLELYYEQNVDKRDIKKVIKEENSGNDHFIEKMFFIENYLMKNNFYNYKNNQNLSDLIKKFLINYNREFNPVCSLFAKIIVIALFNFFQLNIIPSSSFLIYNSEDNEYDKELFFK